MARGDGGRSPAVRWHARGGNLPEEAGAVSWAGVGPPWRIAMRSLVLALLPAVLVMLALSTPAAADCADIAKALVGVVTDLTCLESTDLTTRNDATTPPDNSRLGLRSEEHTSELQSLRHLVCRLLLEKKKQ